MYARNKIVVIISIHGLIFKQVILHPYIIAKQKMLGALVLVIKNVNFIKDIWKDLHIRGLWFEINFTLAQTGMMVIYRFYTHLDA